MRLIHEVTLLVPAELSFGKRSLQPALSVIGCRFFLEPERLDYLHALIPTPAADHVVQKERRGDQGDECRAQCCTPQMPAGS